MIPVTARERAANDLPQSSALLTLKGKVMPHWIDYNGHMTEWQYYKIFADAGENFLREMGFTEEYRLRGLSFFSVEGHQRNLRECRVGAALHIFTDMIGYDPLRLHIYQYAVDVERNITLATGEHMMVHVDTNLRKATPAHPDMLEAMERAMQIWAPQNQPKGLSACISPVRPAV